MTADPQARTKRIASVATAVAISISVYLMTRWRQHHDDKPPAPATAAPGSASTPAPTPDAGAAAPRLRTGRRAEVDALRTTIRRLAEQRQATPTAPATGSASTPAPTLPPGELAKEYIQASVKELIPELTACYEEGLARNPKLAGTITVSFMIEGEPEVGGVIGESTIVEGKSDLVDPMVRECIQQTMYAIQIDPPAAGGVVRVNYPFVFRPAEDNGAAGSASK